MKCSVLIFHLMAIVLNKVFCKVIFKENIWDVSDNEYNTDKEQKVEKSALEQKFQQMFSDVSPSLESENEGLGGKEIGIERSRGGGIGNEGSMSKRFGITESDGERLGGGGIEVKVSGGKIMRIKGSEAKGTGIEELGGKKIGTERPGGNEIRNERQGSKQIGIEEPREREIRLEGQDDKKIGFKGPGSKGTGIEELGDYGIKIERPGERGIRIEELGGKGSGINEPGGRGIGMEGPGSKGTVIEGPRGKETRIEGLVVKATGIEEPEGNRIGIERRGRRGFGIIEIGGKGTEIEELGGKIIGSKGSRLKIVGIKGNKRIGIDGAGGKGIGIDGRDTKIGIKNLLGNRIWIEGSGGEPTGIERERAKKIRIKGPTSKEIGSGIDESKVVVSQAVLVRDEDFGNEGSEGRGFGIAGSGGKGSGSEVSENKGYKKEESGSEGSEIEGSGSEGSVIEGSGSVGSVIEGSGREGYKTDGLENDGSGVERLGGNLWRADGRCGLKHTLSNGQPGQCDPHGQYPCCAPSGWCGNTTSHCLCSNCTNYGNPWRADGRCGLNHILSNGQPGQCYPHGQHPCCAPSGWCGNTTFHCLCSKCINYGLDKYINTIGRMHNWLIGGEIGRGDLSNGRKEFKATIIISHKLIDEKGKFPSKNRNLTSNTHSKLMVGSGSITAEKQTSLMDNSQKVNCDGKSRKLKTCGECGNHPTHCGGTKADCRLQKNWCVKI